MSTCFFFFWGPDGRGRDVRRDGNSFLICPLAYSSSSPLSALFLSFSLSPYLFLSASPSPLFLFPCLFFFLFPFLFLFYFLRLLFMHMKRSQSHISWAFKGGRRREDTFMRFRVFGWERQGEDFREILLLIAKVVERDGKERKRKKKGR